MSLFHELKRRNVIRVAVAYVITAWLILQVGDVVLGKIGAPAWVFLAILLILGLGFPLAMLFAWAYELTPEGLKRETSIQRSDSITRQTSRKLDRTIIVVLVVALGYFAYDKFLTDQPADLSGATPAGLHRASIAVLPFVNMSSDPEQEYFSDGISEELLNLLAKIPRFQVAGRTSSFKFKGHNDDLRLIGDSLGVMNILEGSVRKSGDSVRITAQLIKVDDGFHLWSESYDRKLTDIFEVQNEIATAVVKELKVALLGAEVPATDRHSQIADTEAYNSYLQGLFYMNKLGPDNSAKAAEAFQRAVDLAPDSALAWASLADALVRYAGQIGRDGPETLAEGRRVLARAFALDTEVPEAYLVKAKIASGYDWDWPAAEEAIQKVLTLRPGDVKALRGRARLDSTLGRTTEALATIRDLMARDPLDGSLQLGFVYQLILANELDEAESTLRRLLEQDPGANFINAYLSWAISMSGRYEEAMVYARNEPVDYSRLNAVGVLEYKLGNVEAARAIQQELLLKYGDAAAYQQASIAAASGNADQTMEWLERAYATRDPGLTSVKADQDFLFLQDDPRFVALLEKMNLAD
jgi:TolB-like protein/Tfp pilus assembly protein PilF